ncbi:MAG: hypothetical protein HY363_00020 [Candidatus Aenigmarchaeota archaeon]|nr:hypothetical protein [Candidatus Aenigmarchaeota archaeon]
MNRFLLSIMFILLASSVFAVVNPTITPFSMSVGVGETATLTTQVPAGTTLYWHATNPAVVEIVETSSSHAKIKGLKTGQTSITFRTNTGRRASAMVYVGSSRDVNTAQRVIGKEKVVVSPQKQVVPVGEVIEFFAALARERSFEWSIEDKNILQMVSVAGNRAKVKAIGLGTTRVFAKTKKGIVGDSLITVLPRGRHRNSQGITYFETGGIHGWKPYERTGGVNVYKT